MSEETAGDGATAEHDGIDETDEAAGVEVAPSSREVEMPSSGEVEISAVIERSTASIDCG